MRSIISKSAIIAAIIGIGLLIGTSLILPVGNLSPAAAQNTSSTVTITPDCNSIASQLGGKAVSNGNVCSIFIIRQSPIVKSPDGMPLNNFITASNLVELMPISATSTNSSSSSSAATTTSATGQNKINGTTNVMAMGEFALLEPELAKVHRVLDEKVNVTAIHNHMVMENPKLINVHWETHGTVNTIIQLVKQALGQTSIISGVTATTAGNSTTGTNISNSSSTSPKTTNSTSSSTSTSNNNTGTPAGQKSSAANMTRLTGGPANNSNGTTTPPSTSTSGSNSTNPLNNLGKSLQNMFGGGNKK